VSDIAQGDILIGGRGVWNATPWDYSSLRFLSFQSDGSGELIFGYGQAIYAVIKCRWKLASPGQLHLTYLESPPRLRFKGYHPREEFETRELELKLIAGEVAGADNICGLPYKYLWTLQLNEPPWPLDLEFPYEIPRVFFGHRQDIKK